jgi:class 3 adenylate cyclase
VKENTGVKDETRKAQITMTQTTDEVEIVEAIVVTLDICSSSMLIEDLLKNNRAKLWRDLIINTKEYLMDQVSRYNAEVHKFIGDGWIILFHPPYSGKAVLEFLSGVYAYFTQVYEETVLPSLDTTPEIAGLTFGIDQGRLIRMEMQEQVEFIGRPINIACRLQGNLEKSDIENGYRILMSNRLFNDLKADLGNCFHARTTKQLKNIGDGKRFTCYVICMDNKEFISSRIRKHLLK